MRHSKEAIERIKALAAEGYSRGQIARMLPGLSRNAIIGVLWRIAHPGFYGHSRSNGKPGRPTLPEAATKLEPHIYKSVKLKPVVLPPMRPRLDPKPRVGSQPKATCCWHGCKAPPVEPGKPYCDQHRRA